MSVKRANRMIGAKPSFTREALKYAEEPGVIAFADGSPNENLFPVSELTTAFNKVLKDEWRHAFQYTPTEGFVPLKEQIQKRMAKYGVNADLDEILPITGSQQGLDLSAKIYIDPGDVILVESPTYLGALSAFRYYQPNVVEVDMDEEGMRMDALEARLQEYSNARFIYTIPDFQNPSGRVLSDERRRRMVELAEKYDVMIVEDNPYYELRFDGERLPPIKHYDTNGRVIFLGSMSKTLVPGLRVGWIVASKKIISDYVLLKQSADLSTTEIAQMSIAHYMSDEDFDAHVATLNKTYKRKRDIMLKAFQDYFPSEIKATYPHGGLFLWLTLPEHCDCMKLFYDALKEKVIYVPGETCYPRGGHKNTLRLCYTTASDEDIEEGMKRLARALKPAVMHP